MQDLGLKVEGFESWVERRVGFKIQGFEFSSCFWFGIEPYPKLTTLNRKQWARLWVPFVYVIFFWSLLALGFP